MVTEHFKRLGRRKYEKKKTGLNGYVHDFRADYNAAAVDDILDIHKYLMKKKL